MSKLTRLFLLLIVLALLPLGSFAAKFGTAPHARVVISAQLDDAAVAPAPTSKTFAATLKRCKGPALPGSPCNPALALWPAETTLAFSGPASVLRPASWPPKIGHRPPLPLGPPRLG
ncbi:hypothetical protein [Cypionkella sp.]|uniref:hypothetical protein n=1 Tax=Cypionkella sp. TaxID=2811411 RepID=UPI002ABBF2EC|nr:hypothetical protein [Cypionkella sp.]MDZ4392625.1 hypothetical protein [Cypionkella sp.]